MPFAYASCLLSEAEERYAQIEKEISPMMYGLEKFHHYMYGRHVKVLIFHKPLVSICAKPLSRATKNC